MALPVHFRAGQNGRLHFAALRPHFRAAPLQTTYILHSCTDLYHHTYFTTCTVTRPVESLDAGSKLAGAHAARRPVSANLAGVILTSARLGFTGRHWQPLVAKRAGAGAALF